MATARQFVQQLLRIPGIEKYCLLRPDGRPLIHNLDDPEKAAALILLCGRAGRTIRQGLGLQHFRHMVLQRESGQHLLVFSVEQYLLGLIQASDASTPDLVNALARFLLGIQRSAPAAAGSVPGSTHASV